MIRRIYSKVKEILYTIHLCRRLERIMQEHDCDGLTGIELMIKDKMGNKYVSHEQAEQALKNLKRYTRHSLPISSIRWNYPPRKIL